MGDVLSPFSSTSLTENSFQSAYAGRDEGLSDPKAMLVMVDG